MESCHHTARLKDRFEAHSHIKELLIGGDIYTQSMEVDSIDEPQTGDSLVDVEMDRMTLEPFQAAEILPIPTTQPLFSPEPLALLQMGIYPPFSILVCQGCAVAIPLTMLAGHLKEHHNNTKKLPEEVTQLLYKYNVKKDLVPKPSSPIPPIPSIKHIQGFYCDSPDCQWSGISSSHSNAKRNHNIHGSGGYVKSCMLQRVYSTSVGYIYWRVLDSNAPFEGAPLDIKKILDELVEQDMVGIQSSTMTKPVNMRLLAPWLRTLEWLDMADGKDSLILEKLVEIKSQEGEPQLTWLQAQVYGYMNKVLELNKSLNVVARQWINSHTG